MTRDYEARRWRRSTDSREGLRLSRSQAGLLVHPRSHHWPSRDRVRDAHQPSVYVRYRLTSDAAAIDPALAGREVYTIIWTTTPGRCPRRWLSRFIRTSTTWHWKPSRRRLDRKLRCPSLRVSSGARVGDPEAGPPGLHCRRRTAESVASACQLAQRMRLPASKAPRWTALPSSIRFWIAASWACWPLTSPRQGTGAVHTAPAHGADDFYTGQRYGLDPTCGGRLRAPACDPAAWNHAAPAAFEGLKVWAANPIILAMLEERGALLANRDLEHSYRTAALPQTGHLSRHRAVVHRLETPVKRRTARRPPSASCHRRDRQGGVHPPGQGADHQHDRHAARLVHQRQKIWTCHRRFPVRALRESDRLRGAEPQAGRSYRAGGYRAWRTDAANKLLTDEIKMTHCLEFSHLDAAFAKRPTFWTCGWTPAQVVRRLRGRRGPEDGLYRLSERRRGGGLYLEAATSIALVPLLAVDSVALRGRAPYSAW